MSMPRLRDRPKQSLSNQVSMVALCAKAFLISIVQICSLCASGGRCNAGPQHHTKLQLASPASLALLTCRCVFEEGMPAAGLGLKAVWIGAEKFGDLVGLTKPKPPDTSKRSAASSQATVSHMLLCAAHALLCLHNSPAACSSRGKMPFQRSRRTMTR